MEFRRHRNQLFLPNDLRNKLVDQLKAYPRLTSEMKIYSYFSPLRGYGHIYAEILDDVIHKIYEELPKFYHKPRLRELLVLGFHNVGYYLDDFNWDLFFEHLPMDLQEWLQGPTSIYHNDVFLKRLFLAFVEAVSPFIPWIQEFVPVFEAGWESYYFAFINPDHILMRARDSRLPLTPGSFEQAAIMDISLYPQTIGTLCKNVNLSEIRKFSLSP